jgi:pimeloyl-ACP methyl ester carboxylesterase
MSIRSMALTIICGAGIVGCSFSADRIAQRARFDKSIISGEAYRHLRYSRLSDDDGSHLHVYIEGDGTPWILGAEPSPDPTPSNPLALRLMARDPSDVIYLGRPCYFGLRSDAGCNPEAWTSARYSSAVVRSMADAIRRTMSETAHSETILIGYSGGGSIARLVAALVPGVTGVLTVNANLDVDAWTDQHDYLPLHLSLNPATSTPLPSSILHVQAIGDGDTVVDPQITESYRKHGQPVVVWHYAEFDHVCCWLEAWPEILARFESALKKRENGEY